MQGNVSKAYCTIYKWSFKIDNTGFVQVRPHVGTDGHKDKVKVISGTTSQRVIVASNGNKISLVAKTYCCQQKIKSFVQKHCNLRLCSVQLFMC